MRDDRVDKRIDRRRARQDKGLFLGPRQLQGRELIGQQGRRHEMAPPVADPASISVSSAPPGAHGTNGQTAVNGSADPPARRIERGAVTEKMVRDAARAGQRLVLGPRAVLTPLARDRARASGVEISREGRER